MQPRIPLKTAADCAGIRLCFQKAPAEEKRLMKSMVMRSHEKRGCSVAKDNVDGWGARLIYILFSVYSRVVKRCGSTRRVFEIFPANSNRQMLFNPELKFPWPSYTGHGAGPANGAVSRESRFSSRRTTCVAQASVIWWEKRPLKLWIKREFLSVGNAWRFLKLWSNIKSSRIWI